MFKLIPEKKYKTVKEIEYWENYLKLDVEYVKERRFYHYYNDIPYTRWPFYIGNVLFFTLFYGILYLNKYIWAGPITIISFLLLLYYMYMWFTDLVIESLVFGKYNRKLRSVMLCGFILFLVSEIMLFGGFFWTYFDRYFHSSYILGDSIVGIGSEYIAWYARPAYATLVLLLSAIAFNGTLYNMKWGSWTMAVIYAYVGVFLGNLFLVLQVTEYSHLTFGISDTVYGSCFYLLTGFHGLHVLIGMIFLTVQTERLVNWQFTRERHLGFLLAMMYWHFVDIIWIFLLLTVYMNTAYEMAFCNRLFGSTYINNIAA